MARIEGFYNKNPGTEIAISQMTGKEPTGSIDIRAIASSTEPCGESFPLRLRVHMLGVLPDSVPADWSRRELGTQDFPGSQVAP